MEILTLRRGCREVVQLSVRRLGVDQASALQFKFGSEAWTLYSPLNPSANPALYEMVIAHGSPDEFPTPHPAGTIVISESISVWMRAASGRQIRAEQIGRIEVV